eukprot:1680916-Pyramimonas_sp.AAC.1
MNGGGDGRLVNFMLRLVLTNAREIAGVSCILCARSAAPADSELVNAMMRRGRECEGGPEKLREE